MDMAILAAFAEDLGNSLRFNVDKLKARLLLLQEKLSTLPMFTNFNF